MRPDKPLHIGVCAGVGVHAGRFVISAEYLSGYEILGVYKTAGDAQADLLRVKRVLAAKRAGKGGK
jgi:hypothetical protein